MLLSAARHPAAARIGTQITRHDNNADRRLSVAHSGRKFCSVHRARHLHIREDNPDVVVAFEYANGFIGIGSEQGLKPCVLHKVPGHQQEMRLAPAPRQRRRALLPAAANIRPPGR